MFPSYRFCYMAAFSETDQCVNWPYLVQNDGYPQVDKRAHRFGPAAFVCELAFGPVEGRVRVHRKCGNKRCLNPRHLDRRPVRIRPGHCRKLTDRQVQNIRKAYAKGGVSQHALAAKYGVSRTSIQCILFGRSYARLPRALEPQKVNTRKPPSPQPNAPT